MINHLEALIFCASHPISTEDLVHCLSELLDTVIPKDDVLGAIQKLMEKYESEDFAFKIYKVAGGYQFKTKSDYHPSIALFLKQNTKKHLSKSALETLAIVAYKQPVTKTEIEKIRGVGSDYAIQKLLDKELIVIKGKADAPGRPILYKTGDKFMEYFGLDNLDDLPQPKDFSVKEEENSGLELKEDHE